MPNPEFDIWGGDWEEIEEKITNLSDDISTMWPAYRAAVEAALNAPELDIVGCYDELLWIQALVYDLIESARETVEPWQPVFATPNVFDALSENDKRPYDYDDEHVGHEEQTRSGRFGKCATSFAINYVSLFKQPAEQLSIEQRNLN